MVSGSLPHSHRSSTPERNLDADAFSAEYLSLSLARSLWSALEPTKNAGESPVSGLILERCWHPCFLATVLIHRCRHRSLKAFRARPTEVLRDIGGCPGSG